MGHIPKPFKRPSIEIGASGGRTWQEVSPVQLSIGDIVPDHGKVERIEISSSMVAFSTHFLVAARFLSGEVYNWRATDRIKAFTTGDSPWPDAEEYLSGHRI